MRPIYRTVEEVLHSPWGGLRPKATKPTPSDRVLCSTRLEDNIYAESRVTLRPVALLAFGAGFVIRLVKRRQEREQTNDSSAQAAGADPNETEVQ